MALGDNACHGAQHVTTVMNCLLTKDCLIKRTWLRIHELLVAKRCPANAPQGFINKSLAVTGITSADKACVIAVWYTIVRLLKDIGNNCYAGWYIHHQSHILTAESRQLQTTGSPCKSRFKGHFESRFGGHFKGLFGVLEEEEHHNHIHHHHHHMPSLK